MSADYEIKGVIAVADKYGKKAQVDLINVVDKAGVAKAAAAAGDWPKALAAYTRSAAARNTPEAQAGIAQARKQIADAPAAEAIFFRQTTTFGIRRRLCGRSKLQRSHETVETAFGPIRIKVGRRGAEILSVSPEFSDCQAAAQAHGAPVKEILRAAAAAGHLPRDQDATTDDDREGDGGDGRVLRRQDPGRLPEYREK